jgi:hypothetical protein
MPGQSESGDLHVVQSFPGGMLLAAIDGLGHGPEAAEAARLAADVLAQHASGDPGHLMALCHQAMRGSRGAAMLVLSLSAPDERCAWFGVGNVEGWRCADDGAREALISAAGVVGYNLPAPRTRTCALVPGDTFVLATDGVRPEFGCELLAEGDPAAIAGDILHRFGRGTDDALVLVARWRGGTA